MNRKTLNRFFVAFLVLCTILWAGARTGSAAPERKVAVVPFTVYAEKDLTFLQKGVVDMLTSRLSQEGEVAVLGREATAAALQDIEGPLNPGKAASFGKSLNADYVLYGSLTVFGESVSVDAKMVDVTGAKPPLSFFTQSQSLGEVIPAIDRFAADINAKVFDRRVEAPAAARPAGTPSTATSPQPPAPDIYAHPEKLIQGGFGEASDQQTMGSSFFLTQPWKSRSFKELINGIDLGDVDGDGNIETVIALPDKVLIYRWQNQRFYQAAEIGVTGSRSIVGVDIGDVNNNDIPEIFVSALNAQRNSVNSIVYEYSGDHYAPIVDSSPYYFRVVQGPVFGSRLYGQRHKIGEDPFTRPIFQMMWDGQGYSEQNRVLPPRTANVLGFAAGSPVDPQDEQFVAYSPRDYLLILESSGTELWKSGEKLGGSTLFVEKAVEDRGITQNRAYLPMRVRVTDLDGEGVNEVIVAENKEIANRRLQQFRQFTETQYIFYSWDGIGLAPIWKTRPLSGHIRDFAVGDFDGDGTDEIVGALVMKEGSVVGMDPKCAIIAYDIVPRTETASQGQ